MTRGRNFLVIMMDELARDGVGCYGGTGITPNMDRLAARGVRFDNAYTPSPICVPARAAFQSGRYVHQNRCWSNAQPYHGEPEGWAHRLKAAGHETVSIGKLHYRSTEDDNGFSREIEPLHVTDGIGWIYGLLRRQDATCYDTSGFAQGATAGHDSYTDYDLEVRDESVNWLASEGAAKRDKPWAAFVSFLRPHYPLTCPREYLDLYDPDRLPPIRFDGAQSEFRHPVVQALRRYNDYDDHFADDRHRNLARACYFGLCSFADALVGDVLKALDDSGQADNTVVVVTSDHGDMNGHHGMWTKMVMYEDATGIPMILSGPGVAEGAACATQASLIDIHQTALDACGAAPSAEDHRLHGRSLLDLSSTPYDETRAVFSEFHDGGSITGITMLREGRWKLIHYAGFAPQLFDLEADPFERTDLGLSADHADIRAHLLARMTAEFQDPEEINRQCFADQAARIDELGGVAGIYARSNYDFTPVE
ncbi:MAG: sulfatase-like hydrolase/transferase [Alphaproteobacteria bacterium]